MMDVLERGTLLLLWRPRARPVSRVPARPGLGGVQRFFVVLAPSARRPLRRIVVGRQHLPVAREKLWASVDRVSGDPDELVSDLREAVYATKTRGLRVQPHARLAAHGGYALVRHDDHVHLAFRVAPHQPPERVPLPLQGSPLVTVMNPDPDPGERSYFKAWPELLDLEGQELVLIGTDHMTFGFQLRRGDARLAARVLDALGQDVQQPRQLDLPLDHLPG